MYSLKKIVINNLFSFKNLEYYFEKRPILLIGKNLDDSGQERNGSGKSSFIESIFIALTGDSLRGVTNNEIIKKGENLGNVYLEMENNENTFIIERVFSLKSSSVCKLYFIDKNGKKEEKVLSSVTEYNKFILSHLDISREDILSFFIITKDIKTFLSSNDSNRKSIISRFSNIQMLDFTNKIIDKSLDENNSIIIEKNKTISNLEGKISIIDEQIDENKAKIDINNINSKIESIKENMKRNNENIESEKLVILDYEHKFKSIKNEIEELEKSKEDNKKIEFLKNNLFELEKEKIEKENILLEEKSDIKNKKVLINEEVSEINSEIKSLTEEFKLKYQKHQDSINKTKKIIEELNSESIELNKAKNEIGKILTGKIECPSCNFIFIYNNKSYNVKNSEKELDDINSELEEISSLITKANLKISKIKENIENIENEFNNGISLLNNKIKEKNKLLLFIDDKFNETKKKIDNIELSISSVKKQIRIEIEDIDNLIFDKSRNIKNILNSIDSKTNNINLLEIDNEKLLKNISLLKDTSDINNKIIDLEFSKEKINTNIYSINEEKDLYLKKNEEINNWTIHLKSFKNYLFNKTINYISEITNKCLRNMNSNISLSIDGYKELKSGKIKEEISISVYRNGFEEGNFKKFSAGEKARMDMANILAIQELVNMNSKNSINLLILDEILDSCDSHGLELIFNSLKEINKTILIVSQGEIKSLKEDTIVICKENQESRLIL